MRLEEALKDCKTIVVYDLETTGLSKTEDRIIQFSGIKVSTKDKALNVIDKLSLYIQPGIAVSDKITELTGITNDFLDEEGLDEEDAFSKIKAFMGDTPLAVSGYNNKSFDDGFMTNLYARYGEAFTPDYSLDVMQMAKDLVDKKDVENYKLATIAHLYGVDDNITFHDASGDVYVTYLLLKIFITEYIAKEAETETNKAKAKVLSVSFWQGKRHTMQRIYVNTDYGSLYYDTYYKAWDEKDVGLMSRIDMEDLQVKAMKKIGVTSMEEFAKFKGRIA